MTSLRTLLAPVDAAVLVPVYRDAEGALRLVFIVRAAGGVHGGQVALPGGRREVWDTSLAATAIREAEEEIGLKPADVEILADLDVIETRTTGFRVAPFLGRVTRDRASVWRPREAEVAEMLTVGVKDLRHPAAHGEEVLEFSEWPEPRLTAVYRLGAHRLWGATYRIIHTLLPRLEAGEWSI